MQTHENLTLWQKAVDLSVAVYKMTEKFPAREMYGLTSQVRRAAISVPSNIAEGRRRGTDADFSHFLRIAHGSLAELDTQLLIAAKLSFCTSRDYEAMHVQITEVSKMLHGMIKKLR
ncbi:four helix bundle protein [Candidatus Kaiserbacteria bacterium RIFCSPLOWO2_01_FULL_54_24]|uniref:Four helix bundle protein n=1 Tax=Candidatus Kaiserbacteria bacterium RIFCSPLOWO2_01_FULL_54_24 TaxID=1798515 RepID=A0A1F6EV61_9BACT|nr:MAG: four helix bundle protein [Candidatus Kaiserbacteria bacterium RIFCSPLOWO2_01_FULL_54_24]